MATTNYNWNIGIRGQKPYWDEWVGLWTSVDTELYKRTKDLYMQGKIVYGSDATGENLLLKSNPLANGKIYFGANSVYDEADDRLGVRNANPVAILEISNTDSLASIPGFRITGTDRGSGKPYLTHTGLGGNPGLYTNGPIVINGNDGDPVPTLIAGIHNIYMFGIRSDTGSDPTMVIQTGPGGPLLLGYDNYNIQIIEIDDLGNLSILGDFLPSGKVGIQVASPTNSLSFGNASAHKIWIENSAFDVVGRSLTVSAGSTVPGASVANVPGGELFVQAGLGTGTGASTITFQTGTPIVGLPTTLQTLATAMTILGEGNVGIGTASPGGRLGIQQVDGAVGLWMQRGSDSGGGTGYLVRARDYGNSVDLWTINTHGHTIFSTLNLNISDTTGNPYVLDAGNLTTIYNYPAYRFCHYTTTGGTVNTFDIELKRDNANLAGYSALLVNVTEDVVGTASNYLINLKRNTVSRFVVQSGGNVGIGDTSPGELLDVAGNINVTGVVKIDDIQVIGNRIIDDRIDDVINSGDAITDGVIAALVSCVRTHGLMLEA